MLVLVLMNTDANKLRLLSGIKPTGRPHLGNYFGALKQFVDLQDKYESFIMIADYHALTGNTSPDTLRNDIKNIAIDYLAIGLDPKKVVIFRQSDISAHTELAWIFNCLTTMPYLMRAHAYKDAVAKGEEVSVGTFDYPLLMAADILLYDAAVVPIGQDQKQHVEITRDLAEKFNRLYGETFRLPEPLILPDVKIVPGVDGRKMSKSYGNTIPLFAEPEEIKKAVMSIVTDSGEGRPQNVLAIHQLFRSESDLADLYQQKAGKYQELKTALAVDIEQALAPLRARRAEIVKDEAQVFSVLASGATRAKILAEEKMAIVRERIGLI